MYTKNICICLFLLRVVLGSAKSSVPSDHFRTAFEKYRRFHNHDFYENYYDLQSLFEEMFDSYENIEDSAIKDEDILNQIENIKSDMTIKSDVTLDPPAKVDKQDLNEFSSEKDLVVSAGNNDELIQTEKQNKESVEEFTVQEKIDTTEDIPHSDIDYQYEDNRFVSKEEHVNNDYQKKGLSHSDMENKLNDNEINTYNDVVKTKNNSQISLGSSEQEYPNTLHDSLNSKKPLIDIIDKHFSPEDNLKDVSNIREDTSNSLFVENSRTKNEEEYTVDDVYADLTNDFNKLFETLKKFNNNSNEDEQGQIDVNNQSANQDTAKNLTEKLNEILFKINMDSNIDNEKQNLNVNSQNEDYDNKLYTDLNSDLEELYETWWILKNDLSDDLYDEFPNIDTKYYLKDIYNAWRKLDIRSNIHGQEKNEDFNKVNENILDSNYQPIREKSSKSEDYEDIELHSIIGDNDEEKTSQFTEEMSKKIYNEFKNSEVVKDIFNIKEQNQIVENQNDNGILEDNSPTVETKRVDNKKIISVNVNELSSSEMNNLMEQFKVLNSPEFDTHANNVEHIDPIHMTLSVNESLEVTSPNYPDMYPTNTTVDWILHGQGKGIEFNITDLAINSAIGDYLLVKPGGIDETENKGLVFSYVLKKERHYRFMDVDKLFVRFEAKPGVPSNKGFKFSVKMITPEVVEEEDIEEVPENLTPPSYTLKVDLGGRNLTHFLKIHEEFRLLIADMALVYIKENNIDPGLSTTSEITLLNKPVLCNVNWPNHEMCVRVEFGIPLTYENGQEPRLNESDLRAMWNYIYREPFYSRLSEFGITEFATPNDVTVTIRWLALVTGVTISMAMLGLTLRKFICFENYSRMPVYNDTGSLYNEKKGWDLYPTPHQTLPPLYIDEGNKWDVAKYDQSAKVNMEGIGNKSFNQDLEPDEDLVPTRNRFTEA